MRHHAPPPLPRAYFAPAQRGSATPGGFLLLCSLVHFACGIGFAVWLFTYMKTQDPNIDWLDTKNSIAMYICAASAGMFAMAFWIAIVGIVTLRSR